MSLSRKDLRGTRIRNRHADESAWAVWLHAGLAMSELILDGKASSCDLSSFDPARFG
jgi:hypothetical protein